MKHIHNFTKFLNEERAFHERPSAVVHGNRTLPAYSTDDHFTMDCADILGDLFNKEVTREKWTRDFELFQQYWDLDIQNPWTSDEDIKDFMRSMEEQDDGEMDVIDRETFIERWNNAMGNN